MDKTHTYHELIRFCAEPGCPICRFVAGNVRGYLKSLFYENVNDPETRLELRHTRAFCFDHAWLLLDGGIGDALGTAIIYHDVLNFTAKEAAQADRDLRKRRGWQARLKGMFPRRGAHGNAVAAALRPSKPCPVCAERDTTTRLTVDVFADALSDEAFCQAFRAGPGLCLPHLGQVFERVSSTRGYENLADISQAQLSSLRQELAEFIRKNDYRFRDEKIGAEGTAWRRVIGMIVGEKGK
ncbi:MAG: DUF6062 family protein [Chloroflexota bacterium]